MPEPDDPLRTLFQQAAAAGQARARTAPVAQVRARGRRAHRLRVAALAVGACLVLGCGTAATAAWLPGESAPAAPPRVWGFAEPPGGCVASRVAGGWVGGDVVVGDGVVAGEGGRVAGAAGADSPGSH
ncbi:hypothetical protein H8N00_04375, partial [Streptomyces sp. AC563]|nr:hypothetical protein [Streptomyces buecherae]